MAQAPSAPDLISLRALCVAADTGTLGRAAIRLHISQPALSKRLQGLEALVGVRLLDRSPQGVKLTPAGRRLYEHARPLLKQADEVAQVMVGLSHAAPVRLAASHSATESFVARMLTKLELSVELVTANSQVVRGLVADGRVDVGVAAGRPNATPNPAVREMPLADDAIVCAVPTGHPWAARGAVGAEELLRTPLVVRDPQANARWTVDAVLAARGLPQPRVLIEAATPRAALVEAKALDAPVLLSRHIVAASGEFVPITVEGLSFPRRFELVLPAVGEPADDARALIAAIRDDVRIWLR